MEERDCVSSVGSPGGDDLQSRCGVSNYGEDCGVGCGSGAVLQVFNGRLCGADYDVGRESSAGVQRGGAAAVVAGAESVGDRSSAYREELYAVATWAVSADGSGREADAAGGDDVVSELSLAAAVLEGVVGWDCAPDSSTRAAACEGAGGDGGG